MNGGRTEPLLEDAWAVAQAAAAGAGVRVSSLDDVEAIAEAATLFDSVWNATNIAPSNLLRAISHAGGYLTGAYRDTKLVGASLGFLGHDDETLFLHSHVTAVMPELQATGVGKALKLHQRAWSLERSLSQIRWTFDPLVRTNGYFNLMKLGAEIYGYEANFYGLMPDGINEGDESDRCFVVWRLDSERCRAILGGRGTMLDENPLPEGTVVALDDDHRRPLIKTTSFDDAARVMCKIPDDIVSLRRDDPRLALEWRRAVRATLGELLRSGWIASAVTRTGSYVLLPDRRRTAAGGARG